MFRTVKGVLMLSAAVCLYQVVALANGSAAPSSMSSSSSSMPSMTPEARAVEAYKSGDDHRVKGKKFEDQAMEKQGIERDKLAGKARGEFERALKDFKTASQLNPQLFQAYNGLGYSYRKTGDYAKALVMYDQAIKMAPGFYAEAVEYRAEAYLALNRIDDAKKAYLDLFAADRTQADSLMVAMKDWVAKHKADAAGGDGGELSGFEKWVGERDGMAKQTQLMAVSSVHQGW